MGQFLKSIMSNIAKNKGRRLRIALCRFGAMLIEEARDITGLSFAALDDALDLPEGQAFRYSLYPIRDKTRAPQAAGIQGLENRVAKLLKRSVNIVVIENNALTAQGPFTDLAIDLPAGGIDLRSVDEHDLQLGYEDDWPTYRRLKYSKPQNGLRLIDLYAWQWGVLWDRGALQDPWTREAQGLPPEAPVESFLPALVQHAKAERRAWMRMMNATAVAVPELSVNFG